MWIFILNINSNLPKDGGSECVKNYTLVFSPGWWHLPAGSSPAWRKPSPASGSRRRLTRSCWRWPLCWHRGLLEACSDGPGHCLPFKHLAVQAPGVDQHCGQVVPVKEERRKLNKFKVILFLFAFSSARVGNMFKKFNLCPHVKTHALLTLIFNMSLMWEKKKNYM